MAYLLNLHCENWYSIIRMHFPPVQSLKHVDSLIDSTFQFAMASSAASDLNIFFSVFRDHYLYYIPNYCFYTMDVSSLPMSKVHTNTSYHTNGKIFWRRGLNFEHVLQPPPIRFCIYLVCLIVLVRFCVPGILCTGHSAACRGGCATQFYFIVARCLVILASSRLSSQQGVIRFPRFESIRRYPIEVPCFCCCEYGPCA